MTHNKNFRVGDTPEPTGFAAHVAEFFVEKWRAVFFTAALALLLEHGGYLRALAKLSLLVVTSMASQTPSTALDLRPGMPTVIVINAEDYATRYGERSPLDRCVLAQDLGRILAKAPRRLAVDFDLSPQAHASEAENQCQRTLDALLDRHADRLVLLLPFATGHESLAPARHQWMRERCGARLHFADGNIEQSIGMVTEQAAGHAPALRARMADQLHGEFSDAICESLQADTTPAGNPWLQDRDGALDAGVETAPINFPAARRQLAVLPLGSAAFENLASLAQSAVLFGGDWGHDDSYLTPIGSLPGVVVHGARLVTLGDPVHALPPLLALLIDIGIALCFAWVIDRFWRNYVLAREMDLQHEHAGHQTALSALVMLSFVCAYLILVLFFFVVAEHLFAHWHVVIAPLLIALSMLIDGFVSGPVDAMEELMQKKQPGEVALERENLSLLLHLGLVLLAAVGAVACLLFGLPSAAGPLATWLIFGTMAVLLAALLVHAVPRGAGLLLRTMASVRSLVRPRAWRWPARPDNRVLGVGLLVARVRSLAFWSAVGLAGAQLCGLHPHLPF